ncbi:MAG: hypothetical protein A4E53_01558 [Pelotomaculum sp. PtaB.Bin104]|nr:MAG: hypothetical protein A4E53_01558 [Pelotomaculum sp. PtaB.Bin104]
MQWYVVQVTTAHEKKVKKHLENRKQNGHADIIGEIYLPEKNRKPIMPGYIFVQAAYWPDSFLPHTNTFSMTIGTVSDEEITRMKRKYSPAQRPKQVFKKGDKVVITVGPFASVQGTVDTVGTRCSKISYFNGEVKIDADNELLRIYEEGA